MKLLRSLASTKHAAAAVLATAALAATVPGIAHAAPADPGDRSIVAVVKNNSSARLTLADSEVVEGRWTTEAPKNIKVYKNARFGSMSTEDEGGTEATIDYKSKYGVVEIHWEHPWAHDHEISCDAPDELTCDVVINGTAKINAVITLSDTV